MKRGWFHESFRHALSARGVKTSKQKAREKSSVKFDWKLKQQYLAAKTRETQYLSEKLVGGYADGVPDYQFDPGQLYRGIQVEMEHTDDPLLAKEIAKDHLSEDEDYYKKLEKMESGEKKVFGWFSSKDNRYFAKGLLDHPGEEMEKQLRNRDIEVKQAEVIAKLDESVKKGELTGDNRNRFVKDVFSTEAEWYRDGRTGNDEFSSTVDKKLEDFTHVQNRKLKVFPW